MKLAPSRATLLAALALASSLSSCRSTPEDLREWKPSDHKHTAEPTAGDPGAAQVTGSAEAPMPGLEEVTIAAYRTNCAQCHGQLGRGDGPQGPMVKARDLSDPDWQASVTDEQMATTIAKGRGLMPPFALPPATVEGLVHLVRLFNRNRIAAHNAEGSEEGAPPSPHGAAPAPAQSGGASPHGSAAPPAPAPASPHGAAPASPHGAAPAGSAAQNGAAPSSGRR